MTLPRYNSENIFLLGGWLVFSVLLILFNFEQDRRLTLSNLEHETNVFNHELVSRLQTNTAIINSLSAHIYSYGHLPTQLTTEIARKLLVQYPHIYMFEVAEKITSAQIHTFEHTKHARGFKDFRVKSFSYDTDRKWIEPDKTSGIHYPLVLLEPQLPENLDLYGLDTWSVPNLKNAMEKARVSNAAASSLPFNLVEGDRAYVMFEPIYTTSAVDKADDKRHPDFYTLLVINIKALIPTAINDPAIQYNLYHADFSANDPEGAIHTSTNTPDSSLSSYLLPRLTGHHAINVGGQHFILDTQKQMQWGDLNAAKFAAVFIIIIVTLVFTLFFIRSRSILNTVREERDQAMHGLARIDLGGSIDDFYKACVDNLSKAYHAQYAFIGLFANENKDRIRTQAVWAGNNFADNFEYELAGTPCADVLNLSKELIPRDAAKLYPEDTMLVDMGVESYYGSPLMNSSGEIIGLVSVLDTEPMELTTWTAPMLTIFSERISAEIERHTANKSLQELNNELEQRIKDRTEKYRQAKQEAERANRAKSEFLSRMSHEFRTPMNAVLGFSQLMEIDKELNERHNDNVNEIIQAGRHMLGLIDEILDLSAIEAGKINVSLEDTSVSDVVSRALSLVGPIAEKHDISLECTPDNSTGVHVLADSKRMTEVLLNLLSNAIKYNQSQGKIWLSCDKDNDYFYLHVHDDGVGLSDEQMNNIFDPFNRAGAETTQISGTGIGLSISRELMLLMNGDITITSEPGIDTCFTIKIPLSSAAN